MTKKIILFLTTFVAYAMTTTAQSSANQTEVMAWGNLTGIRVDGELLDFETMLTVGDRHSGKERYSTTYERIGDMQQVKTRIERVDFLQQVTDVGKGQCHIHLELVSDTTQKVAAGICLHLDAQKYGPAIKVGMKNISIQQTGNEGDERSIQMDFPRSVRPVVNRTERSIEIFVPVMSSLKKKRKASLDITLKAQGPIDHTDAVVEVDATHPGRSFLGIGGNFRLQNPRVDPAVIDYCLNNIRVAYGRVEMPWRQWQPEEGVSFLDSSPEKLPLHVRQSMEMAQRLAAQGMPVIVSCWFPPAWAVEGGSLDRKQRAGVAAHRLDAHKQQKIIASLTDYLVYLKNHYGVEAVMFSFNESDLGIDVLHTPRGHADFIKSMGKEMISRGLATKMLLGDTSDANPTKFIVPAMKDSETHPYIGAVSFHSWRGCDDRTLQVWADAAQQLGVPLLVGEGSTDAAAWRYPQIFKESTFALYEINLYVRMCNICQPQSILQWQLTSDYSLLWGGGIFGSSGEMTPTQRFWNIKQLASTPEGSFSLPLQTDKATLNGAAFGNKAKGEYCVHLVNNGAACKALIKGLPETYNKGKVMVTNAEVGMKEMPLSVENGKLMVDLPPVSFVTVFLEKEVH